MSRKDPHNNHHYGYHKRKTFCLSITITAHQPVMKKRNIYNRVWNVSKQKIYFKEKISKFNKGIEKVLNTKCSEKKSKQKKKFSVKRG